MKINFKLKQTLIITFLFLVTLSCRDSDKKTDDVLNKNKEVTKDSGDHGSKPKNYKKIITTSNIIGSYDIPSSNIDNNENYTETITGFLATQDYLKNQDNDQVMYDSIEDTNHSIYDIATIEFKELKKGFIRNEIAARVDSIFSVYYIFKNLYNEDKFKNLEIIYGWTVCADDFTSGC